MNEWPWDSVLWHVTHRVPVNGVLLCLVSPSLPLFLLLWARTWFWSWKWLLTAWGHRPHFKVPRAEQKQTLGTLETPWSQSTYKKVLMPSFVILRRQATHFNSGNSICWSAKHAEQLCSLKPTWLSGWMDTTHPDLHKSPWWENWQRKSCIFPNKVRIMFSISVGVRG